MILFLILQQNHSSEETLEPLTIIPIETEQQNIAEELPIEDEEEHSDNVIVDIKGAVKYPGVYELTSEDRIIDVIELAGGYTNEADSKFINHAQKLQDEMVIYIPIVGEVIEDHPIEPIITTTTSSESSLNSLVNINTATEAELTTLPGIGPSKAQAIISYRDEFGRFQTVDELKNVSGIGDKTIEKLKEFITIK
ncbi:helix-hairpin-helix domain-containing protein [Ureibacillus sp. MALMAid1270]|uniref:helix-hairpin-helix domain-containing protein n=1 Tax=Ureibacillus sp. MALMAid1270 TaxID=3411629 RepID=UPI003BA6A71E